MLVVYGIKNCDTCRRALKYLRERNIDFRFHDVREDGIDIQTLERWSGRIDWQKLLNRRGLTWRKIPESDRANMTQSRAFAEILDRPTLIKRPVLEHPDFIAVGFSERRFGDYLERAS